MIDVIWDKNLVKPKGTEKSFKSKKTEPKTLPTGKLCSSRLQEIKQKGKLDDRMRCAQAASPSPSTTMTEGSEGSGKTE